MFDIPGQVPEFEQAIVAACLQDERARERAFHLSSGDFGDPQLGQIWEAIQTLHGKGEGVDALTVSAQLERWDKLNGLGNMISDLAKSSINPASAKTYVGHIYQAGLCRSTLAAAGELGTLSATGLKMSEEEYRKAYNEIVQSGLPPTLKSAIERSSVGVQRLIDEMENPIGVKNPIYIKSPNVAAAGGLARILYPGYLTTVIGGSGDGKTAWMTQVAENAAMDGATVVIVDGEIAPTEAHARRLQRYTGIASDKFLEQVYTGRSVLTPDEWATIRDINQKQQPWLERLHYLYTPKANLDVWSVIDQLRELHREEPISLIVLDYIQLFEATDKQTTQAQAIAWAMQGIKNFCGSIGAHGYIGSQYNREAKREKVRTQDGALGSSGIGQKSNLVLTMKRELNMDSSPEIVDWGGQKIYVEPGEPSPFGEFRIAKSSFGRSGQVCKMFFDGKYYYWRDVETRRIEQ